MSGGLEAGKKRGQVLNQRGKQEAEGSERDLGGYKDPDPKLSCLFLVRVPGGPGLQDLHVACVEGGMLKTQLLAQDSVSQSGAQRWAVGCGEEPLKRTQPKEPSGEQVCLWWGYIHTTTAAQVLLVGNALAFLDASSVQFSHSVTSDSLQHTDCNTPVRY